MKKGHEKLTSISHEVSKVKENFEDNIDDFDYITTRICVKKEDQIILLPKNC